MNIRLRFLAMAMMATPLASNVVWADYSNEHFQAEYEKMLSKQGEPGMDQYSIDTFRVNRALDKALDKEYATFGMVSAIDDASTVYENLSNAYYAKLERMLRPEDKALLKSAQQAWNKFKEEDLKYYRLEESDDYMGGGSLSRVNIIDRIRSYHAHRLDVLHDFLLRMDDSKLHRTDNKASDLASIEKKLASEDAELNRIYQWMMKSRLQSEDDKATFRSAQRAWLKYREAELKFSQLLADKYSNGMGAQTIDAEQYKLTILSNRVKEYKRIESDMGNSK